jgi:hypothetical protein
MWRNTPKDVVIIHGFPASKNAPNPSPFVLKLLTYLRMENIPYEVISIKIFVNVIAKPNSMQNANLV